MISFRLIIVNLYRAILNVCFMKSNCAYNYACLKPWQHTQVCIPIQKDLSKLAKINPGIPEINPSIPKNTSRHAKKILRFA